MKTCNRLILGIFLCAMLLFQIKRLFSGEEVPVATSFQDFTIVIDAGHGGEDGGAVSVYGDVESHMNLAIALKLEQILLFYGIEPLLLREDDISLHDSIYSSVKDKKTSDLKNRVSIVNSIEDGILLSIHQNNFTQEKYSGAQVFYNATAQNSATLMQDLLRESLNPENTRVSKLVDTSVYLMNHVEIPALLIECGFLSNYEEAKLLVSSSYQLKIACVLSCGLLQIEKQTV